VYPALPPPHLFIEIIVSYINRFTWSPGERLFFALPLTGCLSAVSVEQMVLLNFFSFSVRFNILHARRSSSVFPFPPHGYRFGAFL